MAPYIADAVRSVQSQTIDDLEIVVVDDGSTDQTPAILEPIAREDARVRVLRQPNAGAAAARNTGLASATGEVVTFLDADDLYAPEKLERQLAVLSAHPEVGLVFHDLSRFASDAASADPPHLRKAHFLHRVRDYFESKGPGLFLGKDDAFKILTIDYLGIWTGSVMFRRHILEPGEEPFQRDLHVAEDLDLWHRLIRRTRVAYLDETLSFYRQHPSSIMASLGENYLASDDHLVRSRYLRRLDHELNAEEWRRYRRTIAKAWFRLGYGSFLAGRVSMARRDYLHAFRTRPAPRPLLAYLKTLAPPALVKRWRARGGSSAIEAISSRV